MFGKERKMYFHQEKTPKEYQIVIISTLELERQNSMEV